MFYSLGKTTGPPLMPLKAQQAGEVSHRRPPLLLKPTIYRPGEFPEWGRGQWAESRAGSREVAPLRASLASASSLELAVK